MNVILLSLLMYSCHKQDPTLDAPLRAWLTFTLLINPLVLALLTAHGGTLETSPFPPLGLFFQLGDAFILDPINLSGLIHIVLERCFSISKLLSILKLQHIPVRHSELFSLKITLLISKTNSKLIK